MKKIVEEWKIWDEEEVVVKSKKEVKISTFDISQVDLCFWKKK